MPTQIVRFTGRTGLTLTADVLVDSTGASFAVGVTVTESSGVYTFDLTDSAGVYRVQIKQAGNVIDNHFVKTTNTAATFDTVIERASIARADTLADVLADTSELQTNQGDWATADVSALALESTAQTIQSKTNDIETDTQDIQGRIPAALVSGRIDATVGAYQSGQTPLQPTTEGRTVDVTSGGCVGIDWNNVEAPTSTVGLTGTTISTTQTIAAVSGAVTLPSIPAGWITETGLDSTAIAAIGGYQIPQTVPAVGTAPTRDQAIMMLAARGRNAAIVGTTETIYAADGTTPLYTLTLTNDGDYTTAIARAS